MILRFIEYILKIVFFELFFEINLHITLNKSQLRINFLIYNFFKDSLRQIQY